MAIGSRSTGFRGRSPPTETEVAIIFPCTSVEGGIDYIEPVLLLKPIFQDRNHCNILDFGGPLAVDAAVFAGMDFTICNLINESSFLFVVVDKRFEQFGHL